MTNEEAIVYLESLRVMFKEECPQHIALDMAIKVLEQQLILDKIRERISLEKLGYSPSAGYYKAIVKVLQIIDKYKAESEDKE